MSQSTASSPPTDESSGAGSGGHTLGLVVSTLVFVLALLAPTPEGMPVPAQRLAAITMLMAALWVTQGAPIAATALIPLAAYPMLGIQTAGDVSRSYINANIFLYLGGFVIALGIEKWGLHRRMALHIVRAIGSSPRRIVLGFMVATAFLSMWISNTASTMLMLPIALALLATLADLPAASGKPLCGQSSPVGCRADAGDRLQRELRGTFNARWDPDQRDVSGAVGSQRAVSGGAGPVDGRVDDLFRSTQCADAGGGVRGTHLATACPPRQCESGSRILSRSDSRTGTAIQR